MILLFTEGTYIVKCVAPFVCSDNLSLKELNLCFPPAMYNAVYLYVFRFCAFGIFTMVLSWVSAGLHLGVSVGLGDFCVAPDAYILKVGTKHGKGAGGKRGIEHGNCFSYIRVYSF